MLGASDYRGQEDTDPPRNQPVFCWSHLQSHDATIPKTLGERKSHPCWTGQGAPPTATNRWRGISLPPSWFLAFNICVWRRAETKPANSPRLRREASSQRESPRGRAQREGGLVRQKASLYRCCRVSEKGSLLQINHAAARLPSVRVITSRSAFSASPRNAGTELEAKSQMLFIRCSNRN